ncbi:SusD/RagB family nutrient-binding outer membrane lipoprotein [Microvirga sp. STR05]|uniref:SusD/RagB family nutrient-binding outer membrane lipoprotein n=1 Tax=Hymenobacter duratus TaxID=2771356 RepID=A0ABR8JPM9_9BACT|nr:SusD/RagB family nutrient-binding outer membrane lipoprotein [Hymenobacter duratus]MBD2716499.1 SusD/RagB family nutrient-binding outer membrane lipoprotein [Hymenobacter duratus]MBR7951414.1 SusD/RagB family nutrient-binding outer membrane lipoprotein [Microvirga sp. STR05]
MKNYTLLLLLALSSGLASCTDGFEELNTDPNRIEKISPGTLLNPIVYEVAAFNTQRADAFTFDIMQVALPFPSVSGGVHRYVVSESAGNSTWTTYYRWLANIREMRAAAVAAQDPNYEAVAMTLNAWVYANLTDCFGDVPMTEASRAEEGILYPAFDSQQQIYTQLLDDLDRANGLFDTAKPMSYGSDLLYNNSVANWRRFCNSLRLRLLLRVSKRPEMNAPTRLAAMLNDPTRYPVFTQNSEAAILKITGVAPNVSPWGRAVDFTTFRAAAEFFIDNLNAWSDPRLPKFNTQARTQTGSTTIGYRGIPSAYGGSDAQFQFQPSNQNIALVTATVAAPMQSVLMSYAEVEFIRAEAAQKGWTTADDRTHYERGVKAAVEQWGAVLPTTYFQNTAAAYDGSLARIMLQKYYALYFNDYQQWFEYRRTGLPVLPRGQDLQNGGRMPVRFRYPLVVQTNNGTNYRAAVQAMGADDVNTKVWWEK